MAIWTKQGFCKAFFNVWANRNSGFNVYFSFVFVGMIIWRLLLENGGKDIVARYFGKMCQYLHKWLTSCLAKSLKTPFVKKNWAVLKRDSQSGEGKKWDKKHFFSLLQATPAKGLLAFDPKSDLFCDRFACSDLLKDVGVENTRPTSHSNTKSERHTAQASKVQYGGRNGVASVGNPLGNYPYF